MGGKRPDQYQIAPSEAGSTDYKRYPEATHGRDQDLDTSGDKQRLAQSAKDAQGQPFPPDVPAPSVHAQHGHKLDEDQADGARGESGEGEAQSDGESGSA